MTAGSITVPTIIPLRPPVPGKPKHIIDSNTRIELKSGNAWCTVEGRKQSLCSTNESLVSL